MKNAGTPKTWWDEEIKEAEELRLREKFRNSDVGRYDAAVKAREGQRKDLKEWLEWSQKLRAEAPNQSYQQGIIEVDRHLPDKAGMEAGDYFAAASDKYGQVIGATSNFIDTSEAGRIYLQKFVPQAKEIVQAASKAKKIEETASAARPKDSGYKSLVPSTFESDPQRKASILRMAVINGRVPDGTDLPDWRDPALRKAMMQSDPLGSQRIFDGLERRMGEARSKLEELAQQNPEKFTSREAWRAAAKEAINLSPAFGKYADRLVEEMTPTSVKAWETSTAEAQRLASGQGILAEQKRKDIAADYKASTEKISQITADRFSKWFKMRGDLASSDPEENAKIVEYIKTGDPSKLTDKERELADRAKGEFEGEWVTRLNPAPGGGYEEVPIPVAELTARQEKAKADRNGGMATNFNNISDPSTATAFLQREANKVRAKAATDSSAAEIVNRADQEAARIREHSRNIGAPEWAANVAIHMSGLESASFSANYADEVLEAKGDFKAPVGVQIRPETIRKVEDVLRKAMTEGRGFDDATLKKDLKDSVSGLQNPDAQRAALSQGLETAMSTLRQTAQDELATAQTNWTKAHSAELTIELNQGLYEAANWIKSVSADPSAELGSFLRGITDYAAVIAQKQGTDKDAPVEPWLVLASMGEKITSDKFKNSADGQMLVNSQWGQGMTRQGWDEWARQNRTTANYVSLIADQLNGARKIKEAETAKKYFAMQNNGSTDGFDPITGKGMELYEDFKRRGGAVIQASGEGKEPIFLRSAATDDPDVIRQVAAQNSRIVAFVNDGNVSTERKQQFWAALAGTGVKANEGRGQYDRQMAGLIIDGFTGTVDGAASVGLANEQAYRNFESKQNALVNAGAKNDQPRYKPLTSDMSDNGYVSAKAQELWSLGAKTGDSNLMRAAYNVMKVEQRLQVVDDIGKFVDIQVKPNSILLLESLGYRSSGDPIRDLSFVAQELKDIRKAVNVSRYVDGSITGENLIRSLLDARSMINGKYWSDDDGGIMSRLEEASSGFNDEASAAMIEYVRELAGVIDEIDKYRSKGPWADSQRNIQATIENIRGDEA